MKHTYNFKNMLEQYEFKNIKELISYLKVNKHEYAINLSRADLSGVNLSEAKNLLDAKEFMNTNFQKTSEGYIVFKALKNTTYRMPQNWEVKENSYIQEICNMNRTTECASGVNFATKDWVERQYKDSEIWKCLIEWEDLAGLCVPYNTGGKARCSRLKLLKKIN